MPGVNFRRMRTGIATVAVLLCLGAAREPVPANAQAAANTATPPSSQSALINQYCLGCHSDRLRSGGLALTALNLEAPAEIVQNAQSAEIAEQVIRKLRGGRMPPAGARLPDRQAAAAFVSWLENEIDTHATASHPG